MKLSSRLGDIHESITLKLNSKASAFVKNGKTIFNLAAGQLPFMPDEEFVGTIRQELEDLHSFQYSPVAGIPDLRKKIMKNFELTRQVSLNSEEKYFDCVISNGAKHSLFNVFNCLLEKGDEVVLLSPYWLSYPEMITFTGGKPVVVSSTINKAYVPDLREIRNSLNAKTKVIVINSPNNPVGIHYCKQWMKNFAEMMLDFPHVNIISDEIYDELFYEGDRPTYFYQYRPELLKRTVIVNGISKTMASTGLRIGYIIAPKVLAIGVIRLQGHSTSSANSLVQRALLDFDFTKIPDSLTVIKERMKKNSIILKNVFEDNDISSLWYQPLSAFYYFIDFSKAPVIEKYNKGLGAGKDHSMAICENLLNEHGLVLVPGKAFGSENSGRISLVLEPEQFLYAANLLGKFIASAE